MTQEIDSKQFILNALNEDIGDGDHSSLASIPADTTGAARLLVKESGVLAGMEVAKQIFNLVDPELILEVILADGEQVKYGDVAFIVRGKTHSILKAERLVLNMMQRMSGIATQTNRIVSRISHTETRVLDTRKTTPGLRFFEKWAVRIGGGQNHRFGLFDMIMLKDNHVDYAGGIHAAMHQVRTYQEQRGIFLPVEIEVRNFEELDQVLAEVGVTRVMFDNFSPEQVKKAVGIVGGKIETEASGGITEDTIVDYAETGVDFVSMGALTHSVKSLDLSLKAL
ncbi:MAG: carboxylating nicotinate-nucleotide diphosphorylase [Cryomorphaceae bacterium]|nr:carboxylating nicotinate-nucleotide diphosphorylase [Cryomorphaceae bacterium]